MSEQREIEPEWDVWHSPALAAVLNAIPFPFGIGYAWRRMWSSCITSLFAGVGVGIIGAVVSSAAAFMSTFPDGGGLDAWAWVVIAGFGIILPAVTLLVSSRDIYGRLKKSNANEPVAPIVLVLVIVTLLPFVPIIYNGLN